MCVWGGGGRVELKRYGSHGNHPPIALFTSPIILPSSQIIFFNVNEVMTCQSLKTFSNLSAHSEKDLISFPAWPVSSTRLALTSLQLCPILGPSSMLFLLSRMVFPHSSPGCLPSYPLVLRLNITVLEKLFLDPLNLKLDTSTSPHLPP